MGVHFSSPGRCEGLSCGSMTRAGMMTGIWSREQAFQEGEGMHSRSNSARCSHSLGLRLTLWRKVRIVLYPVLCEPNILQGVHGGPFPIPVAQQPKVCRVGHIRDPKAPFVFSFFHRNPLLQQVFSCTPWTAWSSLSFEVRDFLIVTTNVTVTCQTRNARFAEFRDLWMSCCSCSTSHGVSELLAALWK